MLARAWLALILAFASGCHGLPPEGGMREPLETSLPADAQGHVDGAIEASDGTTLYIQGWRGAGPAEAAVLVVHGLRDHGGRYADLGEALARQGWAVYALDLRGHGRSQGPRVWVDHFDRYVADVARAVEFVRQAEPVTPLVVLGQSMGGVIAARYAEHPGARLDGLILSAAALDSGVDDFERCGANFLADVAPYDPVDLDMDAWSRDRKVVDENLHDPLVYQAGVPIATGVLLLDAAATAMEEAPFIHVPTLVLHGDADTITHPAGSRRFFDRIRSSKKTLKLYRGAFHDLWHEPDRDEVKADVIAFVEGLDADRNVIATESPVTKE
ncbi:MAG: alpha/beta hydrolase [Polyangiaceae bacterium]|nr:alpha/beta hydrolase [Polyangiaceae bacterium]